MNNDRFKFRVWDKENECYQQDEADHCVINHKGELVCVFWGDGDTMQTQYVESKNVVIEQCTGLKDKNGKLIYEGDRLNSKNDGKDGCDVWDYTDNCDLIVSWDSEFNRWKGLHYLNEYTVYSIKYIEIIGNIHEEAKESEAENERRF